MGVDDGERDAGDRARTPEPGEVLQARGEARTREAVKEHHSREHDVLGVESEAASSEDDGTRARLREVEYRREIDVEAQEPRRAPHEVRVLVYASVPAAAQRAGEAHGVPRSGPMPVDGPSFLVNEQKGRRESAPKDLQ